jgi:hypothetical protein
MQFSVMPNVVILHGYSDNRQSFVYAQQFLGAHGFTVTDIILADYISLEDHVTIQDLAKAFETILKAKNVPTGPQSFDLIVHSTGALVAREWLTRFYLEANRPCPVRRFLMLAPANFGSPLAALGRTMFGRIVKGWNTHFEVGTHILEALEMGSSYSWHLARRDLFGAKSFYSPDVCMTAVFVGSKPYQDGLRKLVDKHGSDGTVYVATANLNATGISLRFSANNTAPSVSRWTSVAKPIAFAVFPDRDHASITRPDQGNGELSDFVLQFLALQPADYEKFLAKCEDRTRRTLPPAPEIPEDADFHSFQNVVTSVTDDLGMPIADYFLEFYERPQTPEDVHRIDDLMVKIHNEVLQDVHNYQRDESFRSFIFNITLLNKELSKGEELMFSLSAANPSSLIGYSVGNSNNVGELPIGPGQSQLRSLLETQPNPVCRNRG